MALDSLKSEAMTTYKRIINKGEVDGIEKGVQIPVINAFKKGHSILEISSFNDLPIEQVRSIIEKYLKSQGQNP
jgi:hypothetical protein